MKLSRLLFKPKWQDADATVRAAAVAGDDDGALLAALPELTRGDPDPRVRLAALKRLGDYERWRERSTADADAGVRRIARSTYLALLCSAAGNRPPLARCVAELETLTPAELETVASTAADRELRAAALRYVTRPALLAQRAIEDPDPALRLASLARVDEPAALERIADRARKTDKAVSRAARERLNSLRIGGGDAAAIEAHARKLCDRIEELLRRPGADDGRTRAAIEAAWATLGGHVPAAVAARFAGTLSLLDRIAAEPLPAAAGTEAQATASAGELPAAAASGDDNASAGSAATASGATSAVAATSAEPGGAAAEATPELAASFASRARFDAALAAHEERARREREQQREQQQLIDSLVPAYRDRLDAGDTSGAVALHARIVEAERAAGNLPRALEHALAPLHARLADLRRWQHWSNQRRRRALCDEIARLPELHLHPDAVATRVREAREEWHRLDTMESMPGNAAESAGLARRFHGVCQKALKPAAAYFEKRAELRDTHAHALEALLERAAAVPADCSDGKVLSALRRDLAGGLRMLDDVDPRARQPLAKRLKASIAQLSARLAAHAAAIESAKAALIARANELAAQPDRNAPRAARELQQQWTALGEGARGTDQRQWREFRAACDRVFAGLDAQRRQIDVNAAEQTVRMEALIAEAESLLAQPPGSGDLLARRRELEAAWRAIESAPRPLAQRFDKAIAALSERNAQLMRAARLARYTDALERFRALRAIERASGEQADWTGAGIDVAFAAALEHRRTAARPAADAEAPVIEAARELLVKLEFLAGIASPVEDRERRMNFQVSRLSARMRGGANTSAGDELATLMAAWFELPPGLPVELEARFDNAANAALSLLP